MVDDRKGLCECGHKIDTHCSCNGKFCIKPCYRNDRGILCPCEKFVLLNGKEKFIKEVKEK